MVDTTDVEEREALRVAVQSVLWNASNYPETVQARLLGQDTSPLTAKVVDAVLAAGWRRDAVRDAELARASSEAERLSDQLENMELALRGARSERDALAAVMGQAIYAARNGYKSHTWRLMVEKMVDALAPSGADQILARVRNEAAADALEKARDGLPVALRGCDPIEDGLIDPNSDVPIGEAERLAAELLGREAARYREEGDGHAH